MHKILFPIIKKKKKMNLAFNRIANVLAKMMLWIQRTQHIEKPLMRSLCQVTAPTLLHLQRHYGFTGFGNNCPSP